MTLVEVIVAMTVFAIVIISVFPAFLMATKLNMVSQTTTETSTSAQMQIENLYSLSTTKNLALALTELGTTYTYTVTTVGNISTLIKNDGKTSTVIVMTKDSPATGMTATKIIVTLTNNVNKALPSQIETILIFQ